VGCGIGNCVGEGTGSDVGRRVDAIVVKAETVVTVVGNLLINVAEKEGSLNCVLTLAAKSDDDVESIVARSVWTSKLTVQV